MLSGAICVARLAEQIAAPESLHQTRQSKELIASSTRGAMPQPAQVNYNGYYQN
jgi:hypothetical protein